MGPTDKAGELVDTSVGCRVASVTAKNAEGNAKRAVPQLRQLHLSLPFGRWSR